MGRFTICIGAVLFLSLAGPAAAREEMPDWVHPAQVTAARDAFPDGEVVQVLGYYRLDASDEDNREILIRTAYLVLQGDGRGHDHLAFSETFGRKLEDMRAWRQDPGGRVERFEDRIETQGLGGELYTQSKQWLVAVPGIAPGAVIALELRFRDERPGFGADWDPGRDDVPVLRWEYHLRLRDRWQADGCWLDPLTNARTPAAPSEQAENEWTWIREKIPTQGEAEPSQPAEAEIAPVFVVRYHPQDESLRHDWKSVAAWYDEFSRSALEGREELAPIARRIVEGDSGFDGRVTRVGDFVRSSVGYVQVYLGDGDWRPHPAADVYRNRFGDCKDMAHLAIALLDLAGIRAHPVLTSLRREDRAWADFPIPRFDHCIVAVERPSPRGGLMFIDPTAKSVPCGRLPYELDGAPSLVVGAGADTALVTLPASTCADNVRRVECKVELVAGSAAMARVTETAVGQVAYLLRGEIKNLTAKERMDWLERRTAGRSVTVRVLDPSFPDVDRVSDTLTIRYGVSYAAVFGLGGDRIVLQPDPVTTRRAMRFPRTDRRRPVEFKFPYREETTVDVTFPEEWTAETVPVDVSFENRCGSFARRYEIGRGTARVTRVEELRQAMIPASDYTLVRDWDRACYEADRQQLVLRLPGAGTR